MKKSVCLQSCQGEREINYKRKVKGVEKEVTATISVDNPHLKAMIILALDQRNAARRNFQTSLARY